MAPLHSLVGGSLNDRQVRFSFSRTFLRAAVSGSLMLTPMTAKGLPASCFDERPLVRPHGPSGGSVLVPEVEQHHLAAVVAQLELVAVLIPALDLGGDLADGQVEEIVQLQLGPVPDRTAGRQLHIAKLVGRPAEQLLALRPNLGSSCLTTGGRHFQPPL